MNQKARKGAVFGALTTVGIGAAVLVGSPAMATEMSHNHYPTPKPTSPVLNVQEYLDSCEKDDRKAAFILDALGSPVDVTVTITDGSPAVVYNVTAGTAVGTDRGDNPIVWSIPASGADYLVEGAGKTWKFHAPADCKPATTPPVVTPAPEPTPEPTHPAEPEPEPTHPAEPEPTEPAEPEPTDEPTVPADEPTDEPTAPATTGPAVAPAPSPSATAGPVLVSDGGHKVTAAPADGLAYTGSESAPWAVGGGVAAVLAGVGTLIARRLRRA
jgi:hypothetical protein